MVVDHPLHPGQRGVARTGAIGVEHLDAHQRGTRRDAPLVGVAVAGAGDGGCHMGAVPTIGVVDVVIVEGSDGAAARRRRRRRVGAVDEGQHLSAVEIGMRRVDAGVEHRRHGVVGAVGRGLAVDVAVVTQVVDDLVGSGMRGAVGVGGPHRRRPLDRQHRGLVTQRLDLLGGGRCRERADRRQFHHRLEAPHLIGEGLDDSAIGGVGHRHHDLDRGLGAETAADVGQRHLEAVGDSITVGVGDGEAMHLGGHAVARRRRRVERLGLCGHTPRHRHRGDDDRHDRSIQDPPK